MGLGDDGSLFRVCVNIGAIYLLGIRRIMLSFDSRQTIQTDYIEQNDQHVEDAAESKQKCDTCLDNDKHLCDCYPQSEFRLFEPH